jgi:hypothetical protein
MIERHADAGQVANRCQVRCSIAAVVLRSGIEPTAAVAAANEHPTIVD